MLHPELKNCFLDKRYLPQLPPRPACPPPAGLPAGRDDFEGAVVDLTTYLKGRVVFLGIGNTLKQDDGAGPHFVRKFKIQNPKSKNNVELLDAGTAPENYTGKIKQLKPDTLVIVDAIDFGGDPGRIKIVEADEIGVQSFSTHNISLKTFVEYLKADLPNLNVVVIGIQPKEVGFGEGLSPEVEKAVDELCMSFI